MKDTMTKNILYNVLYKVINVSFPLITLSYVSHILNADGVGKVASAQNVVQYFVILAALGIPEYGVREIAKRREGELKRNILFTELIVINLISTTIMGMLFYGMLLFVKDNCKEFVLYCVVGITIILNYINVDWVYRGIEKYKYIAIRNLIFKLFSLGCILGFVRDENDYVVYALICAMAIGGNNIFNVFYLKNNAIKICVQDISLKKHYKPIFFLLATTISIELYTLLDTTMLTYMCEDVSVGCYTVAMRIVKAVIGVIAAISGVLLPRLSKLYHEGNVTKCSELVNTAIELLSFLFIPCGIGIVLLAPKIVYILFGTSFGAGIITLRIAAMLIYTLGLSNLFGTQILLSVDCEKKLLNATIIGAISNVCMNIFLIPIWKQNGAAIASVVSEALVTIYTYREASKYIPINIDTKQIGIELVSSIVMGIVIMLTGFWSDKKLFMLILSIGVGISTYLISNIILCNPIIKNTVCRKWM